MRKITNDHLSSYLGNRPNTRSQVVMVVDVQKSDSKILQFQHGEDHFEGTETDPTLHLHNTSQVNEITVRALLSPFW